jgi:hypothetical protein
VLSCHQPWSLTTHLSLPSPYMSVRCCRLWAVQQMWLLQLVVQILISSQPCWTAHRHTLPHIKTWCLGVAAASPLLCQGLSRASLLAS